MCHFPRLALPVCTESILNLFRMGFPIRQSSGQRLFAPIRRLTQPTTAFIASRYQGIRHTPLVTWTYDLPLTYELSKNMSIKNDTKKIKRNYIIVKNLVFVKS
jgi:hypothetical protein